MQPKSKSQIRKLRRDRRRLEDTEVEDLERRISEEAPPKGWTPLAEDFGKKSKKDSKKSDASGESDADDETKAAEEKAKAAADAALNPLTVTFSRKTFSELPISKRTLDGLEAYGYRNMTDIQRAALPHALAGRDILGAAKTGSGKTLAFLIPLIERLYRLKWGREDGLGALILSPTRELAMQTFEVLRKVGSRHDSLSAGLVIGGKDMKEEQERIGKMNILVSTPGRLLQHMDQTPNFYTNTLKVLVLDEADRILDMGFQKEVDAIIENLPANRQTMLFSATQSASVQQLARLSLKEPEYLSVHDRSETTTPKRLQQSYIELEAHQKIDILWSFLKSHLKQKTIVFVSSQKQTRFLYEALRRMRPGVQLMHIHGKMNQQKRMAMYLDFMNKSAAVMIATDIAARGLDFKNIDWVLQFDAPENVDTYIHRVGRTARYHNDGHAIIFLLPSEMAFLERMEKRKIPLERMKINPSKSQSIQQSLQALLIKEPELKYLAQRALRSYLRSVHIMHDKEIFDVTKINADELAKSHGLLATPTLKIAMVKKVDKNAEIFKSKLETMSRRMDEADERKKQKKAEQKKSGRDGSESSSEEQSDSDSDEDAAVRTRSSDVESDDDDDAGMELQLKKQKVRKTKLEKLMSKKNTTVLSDAFAKMRGKAEDDDDLLVLKRKDTPADGESDEMDVDDSAPASKPSSASSTPTVSKSKMKKLLTKIDANKPNSLGAYVEFGSDDEGAPKPEEPFINQAVKSLQQRDLDDRAAYQEKIREKQKKKKEAQKKKIEERLARKKKLNESAGAMLASAESESENESGSEDSESEQEKPQKPASEMRRVKRKRPDESSSESNSDYEDSDDDKSAFVAKRMKLEEAAKKVLNSRLSGK